jgi:hypothetical protein
MTGKRSSATNGATTDRPRWETKQTRHNGAATRAQISPRIVAQVNELHGRAVGLDARGLSIFKRRLRRERRDARQAEADLLRGLGFARYDDFVRFALTVSTPPAEVHAVAEITMLHTRIAALEEELAEAKFAIKSMCDVVEGSRSRRRASSTDEEIDQLRDALHDAAREVTLFAEVVRRERAEFGHARDVVIAMTRDARVTVEGLRRIAELEGPSAD